MYNASIVRMRKIASSGALLAIALVLPFLTGQIPEIGNALCPMHLPVLLCGYFCGPLYGLFIGFVAPLLRFIMFGAPIIMPKGIAMAFELAAYGFFSGLFYRVLPKSKVNIYVSLILSMLIGRIIWGIARVILYGVYDYAFSFEAFILGGFLNAIPGIVLQIVCVPILVMTIFKAIPSIDKSNNRRREYGKSKGLFYKEDYARDCD